MPVPALITAFLKDRKLHATHYAKAHTTGWCGGASDVENDGTYYVPAWVFDGQRSRYGAVDVCLTCCAALSAAAEPPP